MLRLLAIAFTIQTLSLQAGGWAFHLKSTEEAVKRLPDGKLKDLLERQITPVLNGSKYPDGGYTIGEYDAAYWLHSADFLNAAFEDLEQGVCQNFDAVQCQRRVAFLFGCIAHEMGDVNFDRYFLTNVAEADFSGNVSKAQEFTDKRFDTVIIKHFKMENWIPSLYNPIDFIHRVFIKKDRSMKKKNSPSDATNAAAAILSAHSLYPLRSR